MASYGHDYGQYIVVYYFWLEKCKQKQPCLHDKELEGLLPNLLIVG